MSLKMLLLDPILIKSLVKSVGQTLTKCTTIGICTTAQNNMWSKWRQKVGLPRAGNEYGPLTDFPDFSFADGRPAPLLLGQRRRRLREMENAQKIYKLVSEMDYAVDHHRNKVAEAEKNKTEILNRKFKPKGHKFPDKQ